MIDAHVHVVAPALLRVAGGPRERDGVYEFAEKRVRGADVETVLDATRADRVLLSPWVPLLGFQTDVQNESLASLVSPRVSVLGTAAGADELRDLMTGPFAGI
jgi:hypothetical protein